MSYQSNEISENIDGNCELQEKELELIQGGQLTPEQRAEVAKIAKQAGEHHGINVPVTLAGFAAGTLGDFAFNALGEDVGAKARKAKDKNK